MKRTQKKPNPIIHMTGYGFVYGFLFGTGFIWVFAPFLDSPDMTRFAISVIRFAVYFGTLLGGLPGTLMGFIGGCILWGVTRDTQFPMTQATFVSKRNLSIGVVAAAIAFVWIFISGFIGLVDDIVTSFFWTLPVVTIAGGASAYAINRYMLKLQAWGDNYEKSKNKAKHSPESTHADVDNVELDVLTPPMMKNNRRRK